MRATTLLTLLLACAFARAPELARARTVLPARGHVELAAGPRSTTDDCDACRTFMKAVEREVSRGKIQGEMAAAIAEMCEEATHGETSQMSVCVAAGEAGLRFATRYLENHPELGDRACRALEMWEVMSAAGLALVALRELSGVQPIALAMTAQIRRGRINRPRAGVRALDAHEGGRTSSIDRAIEAVGDVTLGITRGSTRRVAHRGRPLRVRR